jgi:hypothetical protein
MKAKEYTELMEELKVTKAAMEQTPMALAYREEQAKLTLAKRQELASKINAIRTEQEAALPKLMTTVVDAEAKFKLAKMEMEAAALAFNVAKAALSSENNNYDNAVSRMESALHDSCDDRIEDAKKWFDDKLSWLRSPGRITHIANGSQEYRNETTEYYSQTNKPAVLDAMQYCQASIQTLDRLKFAPEYPAEFIEALKNEVPSIDVFTDEANRVATPGSKPMINIRMPTRVAALLMKVDSILSRPKPHPAARA